MLNMSLAYDVSILLLHISPKEMKVGTGEMAQLVMCSPCKPRAQVQIPSTHVKSQYQVYGIPALRRQRQAGPWNSSYLAYLECSRPVRDLVSKNRAIFILDCVQNGWIFSWTESVEKKTSLMVPQLYHLRFTSDFHISTGMPHPGHNI